MLLVACLVLLAPAAGAAPLDPVDLGKSKVRVDGMLREWGRLVKLQTTIKGRAGKDPRVRGNIGYTASRIFVAFKIYDSKLVRTKSFGRGEDHAVFSIAFPVGKGGYKSYDVLLFAGEPGKSSGAVKIGGRTVPGAKIVEMAMEGGYTLEASFPWSAFREAKTVRAGLRAALRYADADSVGSVSTIIATARGAGRALPAMRLEAERALKLGLIDKEGLSGKPSHQRSGNVSGDAMKEVVAVYGGYLTIVGPRFRGGKQFYFSDLRAHAVTRLDLADLTGDGRAEVVLQKRVGNADAYREVVDVLSIGKDDTPFSVFTHELAIVTKDGEIRNQLKLERGKRGKIEISQGKAEGFDPGTYSEPLPGNMESALLPWQTIASRTYEWTGSKFEKTGEKTQEARVTKPSKTARAPRVGPPPPPPPRPPSPDELLDRVYALYRKDRGVQKKKPRFDFVTDVAADGKTERVLIHGKDIVVFGKGFLKGTSYTFLTAGVKDAEDIADVTARDLTGDGKAEIIVRGVRHTKTSEELGGVTVDRHIILVYKVINDRVTRIFGAETGRVLEGNRVIGAMGFKRGKKGLVLELRPGRAIGWTKKSYPFPEDKQPAGGLEPLLLPWGTLGIRRYAFDGTAYKLD